MTTDDRQRWEGKYAACQGPVSPSAFLVEALTSASWEIAPGRALDLASGSGRNAVYLGGLGYTVDAVDISAIALRELDNRARGGAFAITTHHADLETWKIPQESYDLVLNFNYLQRSLAPRIVDALRPGGHVVFETYLRGQEAIGHPTNPDYLLFSNELLEMFSGFRVLWYREGKFVENGKPALRAGIFAQKLV